MKKVLLISPHLDDAVLSAGQFIAGRRGNVDVLTVFSGIPMTENLLTPYDESCGFTSSKDAMVVRRQEDIEALSLLNAKAIHTDRLDSQYKPGGRLKPLKQLLKDHIEKEDYEMILGPLGLRHPDHHAVSEALVSLNYPNTFLWEDLPARVQFPEDVTARFEQLPELFLMFIGDGPIADKVRALWCYKSQMNTGDLDPYLLYVPERFWHVEKT